MKTFITAVSIFLIGLALGFFVGYRYDHKHTADEAIQEMVQAGEASDRLAAVRVIKAIELIQSGESSNALQFLSEPIGDFYRTYGHQTHNDERTRDLLASIEKMASTNALIAEEIHAKDP